MTLASIYYPIYGPETLCPHCRQSMPALTLTDTYLCQRHGAFEVDAESQDLVHLQSGRHWRLWEQKWYRQHTHADGIRFEIHEALDNLHIQGFRVTKVTIAQRYRGLINAYLERGAAHWDILGTECFRLYGLPVEFSADPGQEPCWQVINFAFDKEPGWPMHPPQSILRG